jgi:agmatine deiminase
MSKTLEAAPRRHGYRMPAEFELHSGCWMIWPERPDNWRLGAKPAQAAFRDVAIAISASERVTIAVSAAQFPNARRVLPRHIRVVEVSSNDAWMRDVGPTFVVDGHGGLRGVDWQFNSWGGLSGGLYYPWDKDDAIAQKVLEVEDAGRYRAPFVLEGGAIHVDGQGTCITTEECLLNPNRNPTLSRTQIEDRLRAYLNVETVIWLGRGVYRDETDGHVDNLCCFVRPGEVALTWCDDRRDPQYEISRDAYERLSAARDARGRALRVHKLLQPGPLYMTPQEAAGIDEVEGAHAREGGMRLAGSYVNFYIANRNVVVPLLDAKRDAAALRKLQSLFPARKVVGVPGREILLGGGNVHCITQQVPRVRAPGARRRRARRG